MTCKNMNGFGVLALPILFCFRFAHHCLFVFARKIPLRAKKVEEFMASQSRKEKGFYSSLSTRFSISSLS